MENQNDRLGEEMDIDERSTLDQEIAIPGQETKSSLDIEQSTNGLVTLNDTEQVIPPAGPIAKEYTLDIPRIPSLELPLNVSNKEESIQKAISMCGGVNKIKTAFKEDGPVDAQTGLELSLNNNDPSFYNEHPIVGKRVPFRDDSIVLKITVPKGTLAKNNGNVAKSLKSLNEEDYKVTPVAIVDNTIKFRELSDFQIRMDNSSASREFETKFNTLNWNDLQEYVETIPDNDTRPFENINKVVINNNLKSPNSDYQLPPPPKFSMIGIPHLYKYKGNPLVKKSSDGTAAVKASYIKNYQLLLHGFDKRFVTPFQAHKDAIKCYEQAKKDGVYPGTKKESKFYESLEECMALLVRLFEERPIWIKRHLDGLIPKRIHHTIKIALALLSYRFVMGPWRNTYIRLGIDPRSSSEFAKYQTEYFKIEKRLANSPMGKKTIPKIPDLTFESNVPDGIDTRFRFDGKTIPWYLMLQIDIMIYEQNIGQVFKHCKYLPEANELTGWFNELDLAKIRRITKYELGCLVQGNTKFNKYRLKYYRSIKSVDERKPKNLNEANAKKTPDVDGDIVLEDTNETHENENNQDDDDDNDDDDDDDDDNGIMSDEADEAVLETTEAETEDDVHADGQSGHETMQPEAKSIDPIEYSRELETERANASEINNSVDYKDATFAEIINRIAKLDPEEAEMLESKLEGFIHESMLEL